MENGYSLIEVKELLGHSKIETTMVYTHLANPRLMNVQSPLDNVDKSHEKMCPAFASEKSLSKDWLSKEDQEAWKDL